MSTAHEEGGERLYAVSTQRFTGDDSGHVRALHAVKVELVRKAGRVSFEPVAGSEFEIPPDLVLLAMGFVGPERGPLVDDMQRGQSLIVWAIAEGRSAARGVDQYLTGDSKLPAPLA